eukprot:6123231-Pleurochrysis_carterae.AAC.1
MFRVYLSTSCNHHFQLSALMRLETRSAALRACPRYGRMQLHDLSVTIDAAFHSCERCEALVRLLIFALCACATPRFKLSLTYFSLECAGDLVHANERPQET